MLSSRTVLRRDGIEVAAVACRHKRGRGAEDQHPGGHVLVFVRRGCFRRSAAGGDLLLDPTTAYCVNPGDEQRYDHPHHGGDDCTSLTLDSGLVAALWGGDVALPAGALRVGPQTDVEHRLLLAAAARGHDADELAERAIGLAAWTLEAADPQRVASGRPATARSRKALADGARELLAAEPGLPLPELARRLSVSPHHLSWVFRAQTGHTVARHRMRLRARSALDRLAGGQADLGRLAADLGFADQSHLCRVLRSETGETPSGLRRALA
jgi:AraC-like DNA-binding protein